jgi:small-conductance mechanosensitive channel
MMRQAVEMSRRSVVRFLLPVLLCVLLASPLAGRADPDPDQLDQARLADLYTAKAAAQAPQVAGQAPPPATPAPAAQPSPPAKPANEPAAQKEAEKELKTFTADIDRSGNRLVAALNGKLKPWMWWVACGVWVALVYLAAKLVSFAYRRLFPGRHISWLGRIFRIFCYLICALIAVFLFLLGFGASAIARPVIAIEGKLILLAAAFGVADLALVAVNIGIDRYLMSTDPHGQPVARSPRVLTLLPLIRNIAMISLGVVLVLMVLGQFGVNIAPLLAGAGVIGVAVGFGSQKLVQDVITGAFMLFENTLAVGDTVQIANHTGVVEGMTIRTIRIRDGIGQLHTLPFSSVTTVINMSRDYGYHPFELKISYDADIDRAIAVINDTVAALQKDPATSADILAPANVSGVARLDEWAVVLSGAIKTPPGRADAVGNVFNRCIKNAFDKNGIAFAHPIQVVRIARTPPKPKS